MSYVCRVDKNVSLMEGQKTVVPVYKISIRKFSSIYIHKLTNSQTHIVVMRKNLCVSCVYYIYIFTLWSLRNRQKQWKTFMSYLYFSLLTLLSRASHIQCKNRNIYIYKNTMVRRSSSTQHINIFYTRHHYFLIMDCCYFVSLPMFFAGCQRRRIDKIVQRDEAKKKKEKNNFVFSLCDRKVNVNGMSKGILLWFICIHYTEINNDMTILLHTISSSIYLIFFCCHVSARFFRKWMENTESERRRMKHLDDCVFFCLKMCLHDTRPCEMKQENGKIEV